MNNWRERWREREGLFQGLYWMIKTAPLVSMGRWYVFRKCPYWFVNMVAHWTWDTEETTNVNPSHRTYVRQAKQELELRDRELERHM